MEATVRPSRLTFPRVVWSVSVSSRSDAGSTVWSMEATCPGIPKRCRQRRGAVQLGRPGVVGVEAARGVVLIGDRHQVGLVGSAPRRLLRRGRTARAGGEEGGRNGPLVLHDLAGGGGRGGGGVRMLVLDRPVLLAANAVVGVELRRRAVVERGVGIGAGADRLHVERLRRPARAHLVRHDACDVALDADVVDQVERRGAGADDPERAVPVAARVPCHAGVIELQRLGGGDDHERRVDPGEDGLPRGVPHHQEPWRCPGYDRVAAGGKRLGRAGRLVLEAGRPPRTRRGRRRAPGPSAPAPSCPPRSCPATCPCSSAEDGRVLPAVGRVAVRAPLRHPDAVAVAVAGQGEVGGGSSRGDRGHRCNQDHKHCCDRPPHRSSMIDPVGAIAQPEGCDLNESLTHGIPILCVLSCSVRARAADNLRYRCP